MQGAQLQSSHKILVVDNEPLVVEELIEFLTSKGFECIDAVGSHDALIQFTSNPDIDLVISDFRMPEMTGIQLLEALKKTAEKGRIFEIIIFTGDAGTTDVINALRAGVADYFQKPLDLTLLVEGVARVLAKIERRQAESRVQLLSKNLTLLSNSLSEIVQGPEDMSLVLGTTSRNKGGTETSVSPASRKVIGAEEGKLAPRQKEVAKFITQGLTNYQIACELGISENTVKIYVSQILRTYNLRNRTQLALLLKGDS